MKTLSIDGRFLEKIAEPYDPHNDCWEWIGQIADPPGYGRLKRPNRSGFFLVHRYSYELFYGPVPEGCVVHHSCRNKRCVNPIHLEAIPQSVHAKLELPNPNLGKTHCKRGHPLNGRNLAINRTSGSRVCRTCNRIWQATYRTKRSDRGG